MIDPNLNPITTQWIPVVFKGAENKSGGYASRPSGTVLSLSGVFDRLDEIHDLDGSPALRLCVFRLLLSIMKKADSAALSPSEWLEANADSFSVFGPARWLQDTEADDPEFTRRTAYMVRNYIGENNVVRDPLCVGRPDTDADVLQALVIAQGADTIGQKTRTHGLAQGKANADTMGAFHVIPLGSSFGETLAMNLRLVTDQVLTLIDHQYRAIWIDENGSMVVGGNPLEKPDGVDPWKSRKANPVGRLGDSDFTVLGDQWVVGIACDKAKIKGQYSSR